MSLLANQVVFITGCSTGIGRAMATECANLGHRVFATARNPDSLSELVSDRVTALRLDVTSETSIAEAVARAMAEAGTIDVLINNAGRSLAGPLAEMPLAGVQQIFDTNVIGLAAVIQAVFPHMAKRRRGRIINIGSVVGLLPTPFSGPYCASKAAVHALSESLRMEAAPFGIDVVVVQPGGVRSQISATASQDLDRYRNPEALYHPFVKGIEKRAMAAQDTPMETPDFARVVLARALATEPPRVIRAGRGSKALPAATKLPDAVRENIICRQFGLHKKL